jgi:hypothetical protein
VIDEAPKEKGRGGAAAPPLLSWYYLATPLFAALDFGVGLSLRAGPIESPALRLAYYAAAFGLGFVMRGRPVLAPLLAMLESAANLTMLMAAVLIPIWSPELPSAVELRVAIVNLALSGSVLVYSFYRSQRALGRGRVER